MIGKGRPPSDLILEGIKPLGRKRRTWPGSHDMGRRPPSDLILERIKPLRRKGKTPLDVDLILERFRPEKREN